MDSFQLNSDIRPSLCQGGGASDRATTNGSAYSFPVSPSIGAGVRKNPCQPLLGGWHSTKLMVVSSRSLGYLVFETLPNSFDHVLEERSGHGRANEADG